MSVSLEPDFFCFTGFSQLFRRMFFRISPDLFWRMFEICWESFGKSMDYFEKQMELFEKQMVFLRNTWNFLRNKWNILRNKCNILRNKWNMLRNKWNILRNKWKLLRIFEKFWFFGHPSIYFSIRPFLCHLDILRKMENFAKQMEHFEKQMEHFEKNGNFWEKMEHFENFWKTYFFFGHPWMKQCLGNGLLAAFSIFSALGFCFVILNGNSMLR